MNCQNLSTKEEPKYFLVQDLNTKCWEGTHRTLIVWVVIPVLILWGLIIPIIAFIKLKSFNKLKKQQSFAPKPEKSNKKSLGFIINLVLVRGSINEENYFWELLTMVRKSIIVFWFVIAAQFEYTEILTVTTTSTIALGIYHYSRNPYKWKGLNQIDSIGYVSLYMLLNILLISKKSEPTPSIIGYTFNGIFILLSTIFIGCVIYGLIRSISKIKRNQKEISSIMSKNKNQLNISPNMSVVSNELQRVNDSSSQIQEQDLSPNSQTIDFEECSPQKEKHYFSWNERFQKPPSKFKQKVDLEESSNLDVSVEWNIVSESNARQKQINLKLDTSSCTENFENLQEEDEERQSKQLTLVERQKLSLNLKKLSSEQYFSNDEAKKYESPSNLTKGGSKSKEKQDGQDDTSRIDSLES